MTKFSNQNGVAARWLSDFQVSSAMRRLMASGFLAWFLVPAVGLA